MLISELPVQESKKVVSLKYKNSLFKGKIEEFDHIHLVNLDVIWITVKKNLKVLNDLPHTWHLYRKWIMV